MKKRWIAIALLTVLLMGIGGAIGKVGVRQESDGSAYALYFVERDLRSADGGDALRSEERTLEDSGLSTEELAAALGLSRVTVSRLLGRYSRQGLVKTGYGTITVLDRKRLGELE